jgi:protein-disulfide isomerase
VEESKEPRLEGSQEPPVPSGIEETESETGQELLSTSEGPGSQVQPEEPGIAGPPAGPGLDTRRYLVPGALAAAVVAFAAVGIFVLGMFTHSVAFDNGGGSTVQVVPTAQGGTGEGAQPTAGPTAVVGPVDVSADDDPAQGPEDAAVTIIEFSDFQCPYCARFQSETLPQIIQNYGDRVRFVYRDFPLTSLHANALKAAEASECADDQGAYWKYHDLLFQNQSALDDASLKNYAATLQLDTAAFNQCLDSDSTMSEIQKDYQDGIAAGVQGTPAFFVNGNLIEGAQPYSVFQAAIEAALTTSGG